MTQPDDFASPDCPSHGRDPRPLSSILARLTATRSWDRRLRGARVHEAWPAIAGEQLARHVEPVRLAGGVLVVRAESSAWATQVRYLGGQLVARANAVLGDGQVTTLTVTTGRLSGPK